MNQNSRLLSALKKHPMTTLEIIRDLAIVRPAARIAELRDSNRIDTRMIEVTNRFGDVCRVARYVYRSV